MNNLNYFHNEDIYNEPLNLAQIYSKDYLKALGFEKVFVARGKVIVYIYIYIEMMSRTI